MTNNPAKGPGHISKGMRKHIRRQKAIDKKQRDKKLLEKQKTALLPEYEDFPKAIKSGSSYYRKICCPYCKNDQHYRKPLTKEVNTRQGVKQLRQCEYTHCNKLFRP